MKASEILSHVDHTLLSPTAAWDEMRRLADEALRYHTASVCVPPAYVARLRKTYGQELTICTVIGFPLGYDTTGSKCLSACEAVKDGADELDAPSPKAAPTSSRPRPASGNPARRMKTSTCSERISGPMSASKRRAASAPSRTWKHTSRRAATASEPAPPFDCWRNAPTRNETKNKTDKIAESGCRKKKWSKNFLLHFFHERKQP